jgi:predicted NAD/FAD-dependent oxidoreductase
VTTNVPECIGLHTHLPAWPSATMAPQVLIVGAGVTGSMLALLAKDMGLSVRVLEKSRGAGGRMATHTFRRGDRSSPILAHADLGAQYVTTRSSPEHPFLGPLYKRLTEAGVLVPFTGEVAGANPYGGAGPEIRHFAAPKGMRSIAEYFLQSSAAPVDWGVAVEDLAVDGSGVAVSAKDLPEEAASPVWWCLRSQCNRSWEPRSLVCGAAS